MDFDEWMLTVAPGHKPSDDSVSLRILRKCWAAAQDAERDQMAAEVDSLRVHLEHQAWKKTAIELDEELRAMRESLTQS